MSTGEFVKAMPGSGGGSGAIRECSELDEGEEDSSAVQPGSNMIDRLPKAQKRIVGVAGAIVAGLLFGTSFNPVWHIRDQVLYKDDPDCQALNYVFSHFCGQVWRSSARAGARG